MWDSRWIRATEAELIPSYFQFLSSLLHIHLFLRCATVLARQHIIILSVWLITEQGTLVHYEGGLVTPKVSSEVMSCFVSVHM